MKSPSVFLLLIFTMIFHISCAKPECTPGEDLNSKIENRKLCFFLFGSAADDPEKITNNPFICGCIDTMDSKTDNLCSAVKLPFETDLTDENGDQLCQNDCYVSVNDVHLCSS